MSLDDAIRKFTSYISGHTTHAYKVYGMVLDRFFEFTQKDLEDIDLEDIAEFKNTLKSKYKLSDNSISQYLVALKQFVGFYYRRGKVHIDPIDIRISRNFKINSHPPLERGDYDRMLKVLDLTNFYDLEKACSFRIMMETGIRVGELCDIRVAQLSEAPETIIHSEKSHIDRKIVWTLETHALIYRMISMRSGLFRSEFLFTGNSPNSHGAKISTRSIQRWINDVCRRAGINKSVSPHWFRNAWATERRDLGAPISFIQKGLGHKSISSTAVYVRYDDQEFTKEAKKYLKK